VDTDRPVGRATVAGVSQTRPAGERPRYGTWIRAGRVWILAGLSAACAAGALLGLRYPWFGLLLIPALVLGYITVILVMTAYRLRRQGYQQRIHDLVAREVAGSGGDVLDVGCGSGSLAIAIARMDPACRVVGVDSWGDAWEYSQAQCEENARIEGVADRVTFRRASAARLPFDEPIADVVVSCLTFHEVRECPDRTDAMAEALRVLRPGGTFAFLDLFSDPVPFTSAAHVLEVVQACGCRVTQDAPLMQFLPLPFPLNGAKVLGHARLITGRRISG
jgi:ubiquinone/menaquinone biosynthesis C-methylase UbiE